MNCDDFLPLNIPPGASVDANMRTTAETRDIYNRSGDKLNAVLTFDYWFKMQVQDRGSWDYKYKSYDHNLYEPFGNFNYGAIGAAAGYSLDTLYPSTYTPGDNGDQCAQSRRGHRQGAGSVGAFQHRHHAAL